MDSKVGVLADLPLLTDGNEKTTNRCDRGFATLRRKVAYLVISNGKQIQKYSTDRLQKIIIPLKYYKIYQYLIHG
jgi:hypothetical protein